MSDDLDLPQGRPEHPMPFTRVEIATFAVEAGQLQVLLGQRAEAPYKGRWALPGGVLRIDKDADLDAACQRVANERLGGAVPAVLYWGGLAAPPGTPRDVLVTLEGALAAATRTPGLQQRVSPLGMSPRFAGAEEFGRLIEQDLKWLGEAVRRANLKPG